MARMGHDSERAALIYQREARRAGKRITDAIDFHVQAERGHGDDDAGGAGVNGPLMARHSGPLISPGLEFLPLPSAAWRRALEEHDDRQGGRNRRGGQDLACQTQIHGTGDGHHRHRVALGRGGRMAVLRARGAVPCFASQQRPWPHGHRLRRSLPQTLREQVNEAPDGAGTHNENGPDEPGHEMRSVGCPKAQQAEDVEDNHEQDAEQDRNQHDRCRKSFHVPNVTPRLLGPPKSRAGRRVVGIPDAIIPALRAHLAAFTGADPGSPVFPGVKGGPPRRGLADLRLG